MTTNMQTQLCGSIPCFRPEPPLKTAKPQLKCGAADEPALTMTDKYDFGNDERRNNDDGLTREDLMDVLSLYLF